MENKKTITVKDEKGSSVTVYDVDLVGNMMSFYVNHKLRAKFDITKTSSVVGYGYNTKGDLVLAAQSLLCSFYFSTMKGELINTDSSFGPATHKQLKIAQGHCGLAQDGFCGPNTWRALYRYKYL